MPASIESSIEYSWRARRLTVIVFSGMALGSSGGEQYPEKQERRSRRTGVQLRLTTRSG
jgi:hypothetical protein